MRGCCVTVTEQYLAGGSGEGTAAAWWEGVGDNSAGRAANFGVIGQRNQHQ